MTKASQPLMVERLFSFAALCLYLGAVFEGHPKVILPEDRDVIDQAEPEEKVEFFNGTVHAAKAVDVPFDGSKSHLLVLDSFDRLGVSHLDAFKPLVQAVIPFLVFCQ